MSDDYGYARCAARTAKGEQCTRQVSRIGATVCAQHAKSDDGVQERMRKARLGMRQAIARQIADEFGPGPWILHEDGSVEPLSPDQEGEPA
jgi:hypothetical protein